jgi:predicted RNase H-like HicB family nuclease
MEYVVVTHQAEEGGFWAEVPALPGCSTQGESVDETLRNVKEAIELHLEVMVEDGQAIPRDDAVRVATIVVDAPTAAWAVGPVRPPATDLGGDSRGD